jgi:hypothetical protein
MWSPKLLNEFTIGQRIILTMVIVLVILFALAAFGYFIGGWDEAQGEPLLPSKFDKELIALDKEAIKQAYHDQVVRLFAVWMKDEHDQPRRALVGINQARRAYIESMTALEKREQQ